MAFLEHYLGIEPLYFYQIIGHILTAFANSICPLLVRPTIWIASLAIGDGSIPWSGIFARG